ncbi:hypothetical protein HPB48_012173 [Haemaphysalis longicornis]|uniref:Uncharacterized protein n=1 Tax=Haemaphysalis longicornis TaxID=44386 RepID=A0A9J6GH36_HAELO|nr:hypothetical protein HPB48_012173 [Haemaphysalis longicornis]
MAQGEFALTPTGKIKRLFIELMRSWFLDAWYLLPADLISKSSKKTGISNALDSTNDDHLCEHDLKVANDLDHGSSESYEAGSMEKQRGV